jgi:hypothetical protein
MDAACTDPDGFCQIALAHFGVVLQKAQDPELHIFAQLVALCGHKFKAFSQAAAQGLPARRLV